MGLQDTDGAHCPLPSAVRRDQDIAKHPPSGLQGGRHQEEDPTILEKDELPGSLEKTH
ncbi:MAG: hypothetical protein ACK53Y_01485 [bacterium]